MPDPYNPFRGKRGKSWGELELQSIAGVPDDVTSAARSMAEVCREEGIPLDRAKDLLEHAFSVSAPSSGGSPRR